MQYRLMVWSASGHLITDNKCETREELKEALVHEARCLQPGQTLQYKEYHAEKETR